MVKLTGQRDVPATFAFHDATVNIMRRFVFDRRDGRATVRTVVCDTVPERSVDDVSNITLHRGRGDGPFDGIMVCRAADYQRSIYGPRFRRNGRYSGGCG